MNATAYKVLPTNILILASPSVSQGTEICGEYQRGVVSKGIKTNCTTYNHTKTGKNALQCTSKQYPNSNSSPLSPAITSAETPTVRRPRRNRRARNHAVVAIRRPTRAKSTPTMNTISLMMERKPGA